MEWFRTFNIDPGFVAAVVLGGLAVIITCGQIVLALFKAGYRDEGQTRRLRSVQTNQRG